MQVTAHMAPYGQDTVYLFVPPIRQLAGGGTEAIAPDVYETFIRDWILSLGQENVLTSTSGSSFNCSQGLVFVTNDPMAEQVFKEMKARDRVVGQIGRHISLVLNDNAKNAPVALSEVQMHQLCVEVAEKEAVRAARRAQMDAVLEEDNLSDVEEEAVGLAAPMAPPMTDEEKEAVVSRMLSGAAESLGTLPEASVTFAEMSEDLKMAVKIEDIHVQYLAQTEEEVQQLSVETTPVADADLEFPTAPTGGLISDVAPVESLPVARSERKFIYSEGTPEHAIKMIQGVIDYKPEERSTSVAPMISADGTAVLRRPGPTGPRKESARTPTPPPASLAPPSMDLIGARASTASVSEQGSMNWEALQERLRELRDEAVADPDDGEDLLTRLQSLSTEEESAREHAVFTPFPSPSDEAKSEGEVLLVQIHSLEQVPKWCAFIDTPPPSCFRDIRFVSEDPEIRVALQTQLVDNVSVMPRQHVGIYDLASLPRADIDFTYRDQHATGNAITVVLGQYNIDKQLEALLEAVHQQETTPSKILLQAPSEDVHIAVAHYLEQHADKVGALSCEVAEVSAPYHTPINVPPMGEDQEAWLTQISMTVRMHQLHSHLPYALVFDSEKDLNAFTIGTIDDLAYADIQKSVRAVYDRLAMQSWSAMPESLRSHVILDAPNADSFRFRLRALTDYLNSEAGAHVKSVDIQFPHAAHEDPIIHKQFDALVRKEKPYWPARVAISEIAAPLPVDQVMSDAGGRMEFAQEGARVSLDFPFTPGQDIEAFKGEVIERLQAQRSISQLAEAPITMNVDWESRGIIEKLMVRNPEIFRNTQFHEEAIDLFQNVTVEKGQAILHVSWPEEQEGETDNDRYQIFLDNYVRRQVEGLSQLLSESGVARHQDELFNEVKVLISGPVEQEFVYDLDDFEHVDAEHLEAETEASKKAEKVQRQAFEPSTHVDDMPVFEIPGRRIGKRKEKKKGAEEKPYHEKTEEDIKDALQKQFPGYDIRVVKEGDHVDVFLSNGAAKYNVSYDKVGSSDRIGMTASGVSDREFFEAFAKNFKLLSTRRPDGKYHCSITAGSYGMSSEGSIKSSLSILKELGIVVDRVFVKEGESAPKGRFGLDDMNRCILQFNQPSPSTSPASVTPSSSPFFDASREDTGPEAGDWAPEG